MATRHDYSRQAVTYDRTRSASPTIVAALARALGRSGGRLLDVGGGTGNYAAALAERGWEPVVVDHSAAMLARAADKGVPVAAGDASRLPVPNASVDAVTLISMLHHVPDWWAALDEARRAVAPGGRVVILAFTREHLEVHWVASYVPTAARHFAGVHQTMEELRAALPGAAVRPVLYRDVADGSMAALCRHPELLLAPEVRAQTSFFEWAEDHVPDETAAGLARLEAALSAGERPQDEGAARRAAIGDAVIVSRRRPGIAAPPSSTGPAVRQSSGADTPRGTTRG